ncbi:tyrosine-type recombinase/integrase [Microbispora sp. H11081]|uniref:tyrosine-type recombinase/integrase n=1 Tax=Microbispora sp. H11081 TaxID=2729107 RepID=UPI00201609B2|nr:tyrosine-type recombinase/integrase [Microbispora sp. H11081]
MLKERTYDVRIYKIEIREHEKATTYRVRWKVDSRVHRMAFATKAHAESYRADLLSAARRGEAFSTGTGLPVSWERAERVMSWFDFACAYMDMKWPNLAGHSRRISASTLRDVTFALLSTSRGRPDDDTLRRALLEWAFNTRRRNEGEPPEDLRRAVEWLKQNTRPVGDLEDPSMARKALEALSTRRDGKRMAASTVQRTRGVLVNAMQYAIELRLLNRNPITDLPWKATKSVRQVDRRVVVNPAQARALLEAVRAQKPSGPRLVAFFALMYYAALRPEEAVNLRKSNLVLLEEGWGELILETANPAPGTAWSNSGDRRDPGPLKHRERGESRIAPCPPELTRILHAHLKDLGAAPDGRIFWALKGGTYLHESTYHRVWRKARKAALTEEEFASPLAKRPYDLRHAAVSTWLNAGVPAPQVAEWAGHSVAVLLHVYAKCISGQEEQARQRIADVLSEE